MKVALGKLERVGLRDVWGTEAGDFTPWLAQADNLALLGDTLGIELQLEAQEKDVGPYRADIVCKDTADESWVLVENQIVAKPNDWTKGGKGPALALTAGKQLQVDFWRGFREYVMQHGRAVKPTKPLPQHWMNIALGRAGFKLTVIASFYDSDSGGYGTHELRAEFEVNDRDRAKAYYALIEQQKAEIEAEMGEPLTWYNPEKARVCRVYVRRTTDLHDTKARDEQHGWLLEKLETLHRVFAERVRNLQTTASGTPA